MAIAVIDNIKVKDLELVAYETSKIMIDKGYMTDVKHINDTYVTFVFKERFLKDVVGTPTAVKCVFKQCEDHLEIEIKATFVEIKGMNIVKEALGIATVLPSLNKMIETNKIKKELKKASLQAIDKYKEGK